MIRQSVCGLAGAAMAVLALASACGSSTKATAPVTTTTPSGTTTSRTATVTPSAPPTTSRPATLAQLKAVVLTSADLPAGWTGAAYQPDPTDAASDATFNRCLGSRNTDSDESADANSEDFSKGDATISSEATSYRSAADVSSDLAALHSPKLDACFQAQVRADAAGSLPPGTAIRSIDVKSSTVGAGGGPSNVVGRLTATVSLTVSGRSAQLYLTTVFITGPQIEANVSTESLGQPIPAALQSALTAKVAARAANAGRTAA